jgi:hypothetical protein
MSWIIVKRRPQDQFTFILNGSISVDCAKEAKEFPDEDKAIAGMMEFGLSAEAHFITERFGFPGGCSKLDSTGESIK